MTLEVLHHTPTANIKSTPLLFVHGAWHGAWCWDEYTLPYFAQHGYHAYAVSLRAHGKSAPVKYPRWISIQDYVADVAQAASQLEAEHGQRPIVIGHSMGGLVVQNYLEQHTAPKAVLVASVPSHGILPFMLRYIRHHPGNYLRFLLTMSPGALTDAPERYRELCFSADLPQEQLMRYYHLLDSESFRAALDMLVFALPRPGKVKTPMLVLGAENDNFFLPPEIRRTAQAYHAEVEIFPNMAHDMMLESGWQSVADRILRWL